MREVCRESCRFLLLVSADKTGTCPSMTSSVTSSTTRLAVCARDCETDDDCDVITHKCCTDGCDQLCRPAVRQFHDGMIINYRIGLTISACESVEFR